MADHSDRQPLISGLTGQSELRQRWVPKPDNLPEDWDPSLPYGGKVYLARKKKPDATWIIVLEAVAVIAAIGLAYYSYYYFDHLHFHVTHAYAHMGFPHAQHQIGQHYLHGRGVDQHHERAMEWFKKAADQGHPHASYNLAVGHVKGLKSGLQPGEAHHLVAHAAANGVAEAKDMLNDVCVKGGCE